MKELNTDPLDIVREAAEELCQVAAEFGISLRIDVEPLMPLAMGHHRPRIEVWPARGGKAKPSNRMLRDELVYFIANCAGDLDIGDRMTLEGTKTNAREMCEEMRRVAHEQCATPIWISGDGLPGDA